LVNVAESRRCLLSFEHFAIIAICGSALSISQRRSEQAIRRPRPSRIHAEPDIDFSFNDSNARNVDSGSNFAYLFDVEGISRITVRPPAAAFARSRRCDITV
jgi:hypothetical protein